MTLTPGSNRRGSGRSNLPLQRDQIEVDCRQVGESHLVAGPGAQGRDALEIAAAGGAGLDFARFAILLGDERGARLVPDHAAVGTADTGLRPIAAAAGAAQPPRPLQTALLGQMRPAAADRALSFCQRGSTAGTEATA